MTNGSRTTAVRLLLGVAAVALLARPAASAPSASEILSRVAASASVPNMTADVLFKLWKTKPSGDPDCVFTGTMTVQAGHPAVKMAHGGTSLFCGALNHYVIGRLFDASEPMASFLDRFDFTVADGKQVGPDAYYEIHGTARDPKNNPRAMSAWVNDTTGLITDGSLEYDWGTVDIQQQYTALNAVWVLALQTVRSSKYAATLQVVYSNFRVTP
jgi:hypothetical protein